MNGSVFEFNRVTFALPTQSFKVTAFISTEERLPAVTEFVLRLLHTCGQVTLAGFRDYFGFSEAEALSVIESLDRLGYVRLTDESLALSEQMLARFDVSPDDFPWVTKLKKRTDIIPFDLLAFTSLRRIDFVFASDNWVKLNPVADVVGTSVARARQAYRENFGQIERESARSRGGERERSFGVHSIENVEARRPSFIPLTLSLSLDQSGHFVNSLPDEFERGAKPELLNKFRERTADEFERHALADSNGVEAFLDLFKLDFLRQYVEGSHFDLTRYAADVKSGLATPTGVNAMFGGLYLKHNLENIALHVRDERTGMKGMKKHLTSLAWVAPDYSFWGRGEDFRVAVDALGKALKAGGAGDELFMFDCAQERQEALVRSKYTNTGVTELHLFRPDVTTAGPLENSLELMLYPGRFAVAMLHVQLEGCPGVRVPIGVLTQTTQHLHLIHKLLMGKLSGNRYAGRWPPKKENANPKRPKTLIESCGFIHYSDFGSDTAVVNN